MIKKTGKPGEQYYGTHCKACGEILLLSHRFNPNSTTTLVECDKCGNENNCLPEEILLYEIVQVH